MSGELEPVTIGEDALRGLDRAPHDELREPGTGGGDGPLRQQRRSDAGW